ncbi:Thermophilic serine proteinase precursor [Vibrio aerogenes CECT 7868]|uniref:Thermophilic serine proteinase n=1 Tax=Vibrio aerogenes CECT 7868 TaxID=1216006 RepID=A0A1M5ZT82_9VIBR|nr:S8 family serine peptidase [Vibrio aerogenes]SHI27505.1 Thermophilic serine proteinase precursor [Vibrio aerogenes CECT 7868]
MRQVKYLMLQWKMILQWKHWLWILLLPLATNALAHKHKNEVTELRPGTVIYQIDANASPDDLKGLNALLKSQGLVSERTLEGSQIVIATFEHHGREKAIAKIIDKSGYVAFAEPDYIVQPTLQPNDTFFSYQWHHNNVNSPQAWDITTGSNAVLVGVCDTGFDVNHPDLGPNLRTDLAYNANDGSDYIYDANGHGTGSAGTLGAVGNNGIGVAGANWNVDIIPVRIAISDQNSSAYISTMAACIEYAADNGARVVNLSYGGIQYETIDAAAQYLRSKNGLLFMSAGNSGEEHDTYPDFTSFIGVGATDRNDNRASFSSWGTYVDITAPGVDIATTYPDNQYVYYSGTSFSSPLTAGIAALMVAANPAITPAEIETGLFATAADIGAPGDDNVYGHGLVDAYAAVMYATNLNQLVAPVADIVVSSNSVPFGSSVNFDASGSTDGDGSIVSYLWNFGDGTTSASVMATHTYAQAGSYQVSLTVTDNDGLTDAAVTTIQVTNALPTPVLQINNPADSYNIGESIFFVGSNSTDSDGTIVSYLWEFGNGDTSSLSDPEYAFASAGTYTVTLTVTDNAGSPNSTDVMVTVVDPSALNVPGGLAASVDGLAVTLTWQDNNTNEAEYVVERGVKYRGRIRFETVAELPADSTSYVDTVPDTGDFRYRVIARNSGDEAISETITVTVDSNTNPEPEPGGLAAPDNLAVTPSGVNISLSWSDNSDDELGFYIERGLKVKGQIEFALIGQVGANDTSFTDSGFSALPGGNYSYRVQAYKSGEVSGYSNTVEIRKK